MQFIVNPFTGELDAVGTGGGGGPNVQTLTGNTGGAVSPTGNNINVIGDTTSINIAGNPGTSTLTASGSVHIVYKTLTAAQIKAIDTTAVAFISAPGPGKIIMPNFCAVKLVYGGTSPFTDGCDIELSYFDGVSYYQLSNFISNGGPILSSATTYFSFASIFPSASSYPASHIQNLPVVIDGFTGGAPYAGNAANDNSVIVALSYTVLTL